MIGIMFSRLGPYHHARLAALHRQAPITVFESVGLDDTYAWRPDTGTYPYPIVRLFESSSALRESNVLARVQAALDRAAPDVLCISGWASAIALSALDWCLRRGVPAVLMSDSTERDDPRVIWRELPKSLIVRLFSAAVVAGAPHAAYVQRLGMQSRVVFEGYDVVDNRYFATEVDRVRADADRFRKELGLPDKYFLASARFVAKKNIPGLLKGYAAYLASVPTESWPLVILGSGELEEEVQQKIVEYGIEGQVFLPGFKQYEHLPVYYALASVFVHPSTSEQWGLVVNEAMASGLPVIVSDRCGCAEDLVRPGVNGCTFAPQDSTALAGLMRRMSDGSLDLRAMGQASRDIIARWSPELFAESIVAAARQPAKVRRPQSAFGPVLLRGAIAIRERRARSEGRRRTA